jgi:hypothetical protein
MKVKPAFYRLALRLLFALSQIAQKLNKPEKTIFASLHFWLLANVKYFLSLPAKTYKNFPIQNSRNGLFRDSHYRRPLFRLAFIKLNKLLDKKPCQRQFDIFNKAGGIPVVDLSGYTPLLMVRFVRNWLQFDKHRSRIILLGLGGLEKFDGEIKM